MLVSSDYQLTALTGDEATVSWDSTYTSPDGPKNSTTLYGAAWRRNDPVR